LFFFFFLSSSLNLKVPGPFLGGMVFPWRDLLFFWGGGGESNVYVHRSLSENTVYAREIKRGHNTTCVCVLVVQVLYTIGRSSSCVVDYFKCTVFVTSPRTR